jgi:hypothetical protein
VQQAIATHYIGPSNVRGSRVKAVARNKEAWGDAIKPALTLTDGWDDSNGAEHNHCRIAQLLATELKWSGVYVGGHNPDGRGYTFVNIGGSMTEDRVALSTALFTCGRIEGRDWFVVYPQAKDQ